MFLWWDFLFLCLLFYVFYYCYFLCHIFIVIIITILKLIMWLCACWNIRGVCVCVCVCACVCVCVCVCVVFVLVWLFFPGVSNCMYKASLHQWLYKTCFAWNDIVVAIFILIYCWLDITLLYCMYFRLVHFSFLCTPSGLME